LSLTGLLAEVSFSVRYQGPGSGQIGFDGATVSSDAPTNERAFVLSLIDATDGDLGRPAVAGLTVVVLKSSDNPLSEVDTTAQSAPRFFDLGGVMIST
jgi:hypothetical protein